MRTHATVLLLLAIVVPTLITPSLGEEPLRYSPQAGAKFAYQVTITAVLGDSTDRMKGTSYYTVKSADDGQLSLSFRGGVVSSKRVSRPARPARPGPRDRLGPIRGRPIPTRGPRGFFESTRFKGLTSTSNELVVTSQGKVQSLSGDSQLPYLIGNLSMLVLEPLPEQLEKTWEVESGFVISEERERQTSPLRFRPGRPRGRFGEEEKEKKVTAGSQIDSYAIKSDDGKLVTITKSLKAKSAETDDGSISSSGSGTWVFNRELGVPESLDFKQELVVSRKNVSVKIPITVSYRRLTDADLKRIAEERKVSAAKAVKAREERDRLRNQPLSDADKKALLEDLMSTQVTTVARALSTLRSKPQQDLDEDIRAAIRPLLKHENQLIRVFAGRVADKYSIKAASATAAGSKLRTWTDSSGTFTVEAEFIELADGKVRLRKKDGKELSVPLARLSENDQEIVQQLTGKPANPFE